MHLQLQPLLVPSPSSFAWPSRLERGQKHQVVYDIYDICYKAQAAEACAVLQSARCSPRALDDILDSLAALSMIDLQHDLNGFGILVKFSLQFIHWCAISTLLLQPRRSH